MMLNPMNGLTGVGRRAFLGSTALLLAGCEPASAPTAALGAPIRVGDSYWPGSYWVQIAQDLGWFKEVGLNVVLVDTNPDYVASLDDVAAGRLDIANFQIYELVRLAANGHDLVGFLSVDSSAGAEALIARPGIMSTRDLVGKRVGVARNSYLEYIWGIVAARAGLKPGTVRLLDVQAEKAVEAMANGTVDAVMTWEPFIVPTLAAVNGRKLFDTSQIPGILPLAYAARHDFVQQRRADVQAVVGVWHRTLLWMAAQPEAAHAIVARMNAKTPDEVRAFAQLVKLLNLRDNLAAFSFAPGFDSLHGSARQMNAFIMNSNAQAQRVDSARLLDSSFVRALAALGN